MSEVSFVVADHQVATVRLDPNSLQGRDVAGVPALYMPLKLQLLPAGQKRDVQYTLLRLAGTLQNQPLGEFARFEVAPLAAVPNATPFDRHQDAFVTLDRQQIKRFEDARGEGDAHFQIMLSCLVWYPLGQRFDAVPSSGYLEVVVPRSHWIDKVLSAWNLSKIKIVEIKFSGSAAGENFRTAYARVEEAEKLFAHGHYKQVLTTLRLSFEALAKSFGSEKAGKEFFESLFTSTHPEKKEKARDALNGIYRFLHLGPHEQASHPDSNSQPVVTRNDARFALTLTNAIFEYITPET
jgi:hypothetical protein